MPDPEIQTPTDFQYHVSRHGLRYDNPRRLPKAWIDRYLDQKPEMLAIDVMRAFDENWKLKRRLEVSGWKIWVLGLIIAGEGCVIGWLVKFVLARIH